MTGTIFNIQRFSIHDGPGIRTTVFFKGCNLQCVWCHNPESISFRKEVEIYQEKCISCGKCFVNCPQHAHYLDDNGIHHIDRSLCDGCFICTDNCFAEALVAVGQEITVEELIKSLMTDAPYYKESDGGITFSGGECMTQIEFLYESLKASKENGLHTAVDTAGNLPWRYFEKIMPYTDLFLYDLKAADSKIHKEMTGSENTFILDNLRKLSDLNKRIFVRIPFIPGKNDEELMGIAKVLKNVKVEKVELMPFHRLGEGKYKALDLPVEMNPTPIPSDEEINKAIQMLQSYGIPVEQA